MEVLDEKKLEKQILIFDSILISIGLALLVVVLGLAYFATNNKMTLVADFLGVSNSELFWFFPYYLFGFGLFFLVLSSGINFFKISKKEELYVFYFQEGREFQYTKDGISFIISKDKNWVVYKNSEFIKNEISIDILSCRIKNLAENKA